MPTHPINIFYSWQKDLPNSVNRGFIIDDELLREHLGRVQRLISACVATPQRELLIEGP